MTQGMLDICDDEFDDNRRQIKREIDMVDAGVQRFRRGWARELKRGEAGKHKVMRPVQRMAFKLASFEIGKWRDHALRGRSGRKSYVATFIKDIHPDVVAYITVRVLLGGLMRRMTATAMYLELGALLEDECRLNHFYQNDPGAYLWVERQIKDRGMNAYHNKRMFMMKVMSHKELEWLPWSKEQRLATGATMFHILSGKGNIFTIAPVRVGNTGRQIEKFTASDELFEYISNRHRDLEVLEPMLSPMLSPPLPWTTLYDGGYHTIRRPFILGMDSWDRSEHTALLKGADLSIVKKAVSLMDNTKFAVNKKVLSAVEHCFDSNLEVAGLPASARKPNLGVPPHLVDQQGSVEHKIWRKKARDHIEAQDRADGIRLIVARMIRACVSLCDEPQFYIPHQVDFRGRIYPAAIDFQEQSADYIRGVFQFAEGKAVTTVEARNWLAVHGANMYGNDKLPLSERIAWVDANFELIERVALDPIGSLTDWVDTDKPFQFLAFCIDYHGVVKGGKPSYIRVAMDGSCNGLQHLSAMLLDPVGAKATNLGPSDAPNDIYRDVAELVTARLIADMKDPECPNSDFATRWLQIGINRKTTKRSVMVMPYGGKMISTIQYVDEWYRERLGKDEVIFGAEQEHAAICYLARHIYECTREIIVGGALVMTWIQKVVGGAAKHGVHVKWTTPSGFVAMQKYELFDTKRVMVRIEGGKKVVQPSLNEVIPGSINPRRSANSIAPNFVHSYDAAAMTLTVVKCAEDYGIDSFHMIHDDFGVHAADAESLYKATREVFRDIYKDGEVLKVFKREVQRQLPSGVCLPRIPKQLGFDIEQVTESKYFFS